MDSKDFLESILVGDQEESLHNFNNIMAEKISDALEVRKVEIASGIMDEASDIDKLGKKYAKAEKDEAEKQDTYSKKYPGGEKQKKADKDAFMKRFAKEEVEQVQEVADAGSAATMQKDLALHRTNLQKMNMAPTEKSRVMTALKTHLNGRRLNMNQSSALLGYLGKAGGLGDVNAAVRNKVLKQQSAKKDEV